MDVGTDRAQGDAIAAFNIAVDLAGRHYGHEDRVANADVQIHLVAHELDICDLA